MLAVPRGVPDGRRVHVAPVPGPPHPAAEATESGMMGLPLYHISLQRVGSELIGSLKLGNVWIFVQLLLVFVGL